MASDDAIVHDLENRSGVLQPKAIYAGDEYLGQAFAIVEEDEIILVADKDNVMNVSPHFGVLLAGKLSLSAMPDQISIAGGYYRLNPQLLSCIPSTTPTPVPTLVKATPDLLRAKDAISSALNYLIANSDLT